METGRVFAVRCEKGRWKQLAVVRDGQVIWFELVPALLAGWNMRRYWVHGEDAWMGMAADAIIDWKRSSGAFEPADASETEWALRRAAELAPEVR